jgi:NAD(P)-dependent dehydrogenase (short-subunit alcohol dehydrogenase family)
MNIEAAQAVAEAINARGGRSIAIEVDVTQPESVQAALERVSGKFGRLDVAVNNAGMGGDFHILESFPIEQWHVTISTNLTGIFLCLRAELPIMVAGGGGAIVNMASIMGTVAAPQSGAYVASKHGVVGLTKVAALEYGLKGIRVNAVGPTFVRTPLTDTLDDAAWQGLTSMHALGRIPSVDDVAALVAFLSSDEAASVTGSLHLVDAGYTAA